VTGHAPSLIEEDSSGALLDCVGSGFAFWVIWKSLRRYSAVISRASFDVCTICGVIMMSSSLLVMASAFCLNNVPSTGTSPTTGTWVVSRSAGSGSGRQHHRLAVRDNDLGLDPALLNVRFCAPAGVFGSTLETSCSSSSIRLPLSLICGVIERMTPVERYCAPLK